MKYDLTFKEKQQYWHSLDINGDDTYGLKELITGQHRIQLVI